MNPIRWATRRVRAVAGRRALERDMQREMAEHLERATERLVARGMKPDAARAAARREFGNMGALQEEARDARGGRWVHDLGADVRFAARYFARHKATTAIIVAVLAIGTGANAMIFSMFQAEFIRPAPAMPSDAAQVRIWAQERATHTASWAPRGFTGRELATLAGRRDVFADVIGWTEDDVVLGGDSTTARTVGAQFVMPSYFRVAGVSLVAGAGLAQTPSDAPDMTGVMSYAMAEQVYGSAAAAIGQRVLVNELPVRIVGVAPFRFQGAIRNMNEPALWMPLSARAPVEHLSPRWLADEPALSLMARLAPGASRRQATAFARQVVVNALPDSAARLGTARTADVIGLVDPPPGKASQEMVLAGSFIFGIGVLILLVACTNVSSLMVAAAMGRRHEIAVRASLGASRPRLIRQLVTESTLLALVGSAIGLTLAWQILAYQARTEIDGVDLTPDGTTFVFVLAMAVATGVLFGLSPALHATRDGVGRALRDSSQGVSARSRLQRGFVVAQIALSQPLLVLLGTIFSLVIADYRPMSPEMSSHVVAVDFKPLRTGGPSQRPEAADSLIPRIAERPEVESAVPDATGFAIRGVFARDGVARAASDTARTIVTLEGAAPGWLSLVGVPLIFGRDVSLADTAASDTRLPVVIGSDIARALWGTSNPVGRTLTSPSIPGWKQDSIAMTVVGVYDATRSLPGMTWTGGIARGDQPARVYTAHGKHWRHDRVLVRTRGPAAGFVPTLRKFVRATAPALPVSSMLTLAQADDQQYADMLRMVAMAAAGAGAALLLASLGLYGIVSLAVRQRTREIGIRIAVGAHPLQVARMFLSSGVRVSLVALAIGLPLSVAALKVGMAQGLVIAPEVNPYLIGAAIAALLVAVTSAATWMPARRAARVDPARTLRTE